MNDVLNTIDWMKVLCTLWTIVMLPIIKYAGNEFKDYAKAKKIDKYTDILYRRVVEAVKDVYETVVKDMKGSNEWTEEKQNEVKKLAKDKAIAALTISMYECLKTANTDFEKYLDSLVGTALYDLKH